MGQAASPFCLGAPHGAGSSLTSFPGSCICGGREGEEGVIMWGKPPDSCTLSQKTMSLHNTQWPLTCQGEENRDLGCTVKQI